VRLFLGRTKDICTLYCPLIGVWHEIDAYRVQRHGITWQDGEFRWCTLFGSNSFISVLYVEINWSGAFVSGVPKECRGSWLSTFHLLSHLRHFDWKTKYSALVAIQQKKFVPYLFFNKSSYLTLHYFYRVERSNILFMSGYKGYSFTLRSALKKLIEGLFSFFSSITLHN
jgi:hypothetical protein